MMEGFYKPAEAAELMGISTATITRCKKMGAPVHHVGTCGRLYLIDPAEFMEWMNAQGEKSADERKRKLSVLELRAARHAICG
jgi:phage terminase Nu1 subunit (DNA packaging protein)